MNTRGSMTFDEQLTIQRATATALGYLMGIDSPGAQHCCDLLREALIVLRLPMPATQ